MMPSSFGVVPGNMLGTVNEGICVCWNDCWGVGGARESDMRGGENNFLVSLGILWFGGGLYVSVWQ